jgi:hypothetical protein
MDGRKVFVVHSKPPLLYSYLVILPRYSASESRRSLF